MKTRAVGYIRVSTEAEEDLSLDIQRDAITSYFDILQRPSVVGVCQ